MTIEHDLINRYFAPLCSNEHKAPAFGLLDDTALLSGSDKSDVLVTTDALIAGVHFFPNDPPQSIAHKCLAVNVSDIIAKGGAPDTYLLTIALPKHVGADWIEEFANGLSTAQRHFKCQLVGGDTVSTSGPLMISITLLGTIERDKMVRRAGADPGDVVFVSGTIGDAALGLLLRLDDARTVNSGLNKAQTSFLLECYLRPQPPFELAPHIAAYASAAMDISDGLMGDFTKLCAASNVGGMIEADKVPLSDAATRALAQTPDLLDIILGGGDDYQSLVVVPATKADEFESRVQNITRIGKITAKHQGVNVLDAQGQPLDLAHGAFDHFSK